jgi:hypothetical protein
MAYVAIGLAAFSYLTAEEQESGGGGAGGGAGSQALAAIQRFGQAEEVSRRKLIEPSEATSEEKRNAYIARMLASIDSNKPKEGNAMERVAEALYTDMLNTKGGRIEPGIVTPGGETKVPKVQAVKLAELEQQEEEPVEPFVPRSLFG